MLLAAEREWAARSDQLGGVAVVVAKYLFEQAAESVRTRFAAMAGKHMNARACEP